MKTDYDIEQKEKRRRKKADEAAAKAKKIADKPVSKYWAKRPMASGVAEPTSGPVEMVLEVIGGGQMLKTAGKAGMKALAKRAAAKRAAAKAKVSNVKRPRSPGGKAGGGELEEKHRVLDRQLRPKIKKKKQSLRAKAARDTRKRLEKETKDVFRKRRDSIKELKTERAGIKQELDKLEAATKNRSPSEFENTAITDYKAQITKIDRDVARITKKVQKAQIRGIKAQDKANPPKRKKFQRKIQRSDDPNLVDISREAAGKPSDMSARTDQLYKQIEKLDEDIKFKSGLLSDARKGNFKPEIRAHEREIKEAMNKKAKLFKELEKEMGGN